MKVDRNLSVKKKCKMLSKICNTFIREGSTHEINISSVLRHEITNTVDNFPNASGRQLMYLCKSSEDSMCKCVIEICGLISSNVPQIFE